jgi:hypothetical protein
MASDITLDGNAVIVDSDLIRLNGPDLVLDAAGRRHSPAGSRRALVHDASDGLTVNFGGDYPGGVTIGGEVSVGSLTTQTHTCGQLTAGSVRVGQRQLAAGTVSGVQIGDSQATTYIGGSAVRVQSRLIVDEDSSFGSSVTVHDLTVSPTMTPATESDPSFQPYSLFERIREMQARIDSLERRLSRYERRLAAVEGRT